MNVSNFLPLPPWEGLPTPRFTKNVYYLTTRGITFFERLAEPYILGEVEYHMANIMRSKNLGWIQLSEMKAMNTDILEQAKRLGYIQLKKDAIRFTTKGANMMEVLNCVGKVPMATIAKLTGYWLANCGDPIGSLWMKNRLDKLYTDGLVAILGGG